MAGDGAGSLVGGKGDAWDGGRGGSGGSSGGGHGNSGRGSGGDGSGDGRQQPNHASWVWQGWAERVAADPEFPFKVLLEQVRFDTHTWDERVNCPALQGAACVAGTATAIIRLPLCGPRVF